MRDALYTNRTRRYVIGSIITGRTVRTAADVASIAKMVAAGSLGAIDGAVFGLFDSVATDDSCSITSGARALTSPNNPWTAADVGKAIDVQGAGTGGAALRTIISAYVSPGAVTVGNAAETTVAASVSSASGLAAWGNAYNASTNVPPQSNEAGTVVQRYDVAATALGLVNDGVADATATLRRAIQLAMVTPGGEVAIPAGTYLCTTWTALTLTGAVRLRALGTVTIKGPVSLVDCFTVNDDVYADGIKFERWANVFNWSGLTGEHRARFTGCEFQTMTRGLYWNDDAPSASNVLRGLQVSGCRFKSSTMDCIDVDGAITAMAVRGNLFESVKGSAMIVGRDVVASQDLWHEVTFADNVIDGVTAITASDSTTGILVYGRKLQAHNNTLKDFVGGASNELWGIYTKCRQTVTAGNTFEGFTTAGTGPYLINIKGDNEAASDGTPQGFNHLVANNNIWQTGTADGKGTGIRVYNEDVLVVGNKVRGCLIGVESTSSPSHKRKMIVGNLIEGPALAAGVTVASTFGMSLSIDGGEVSVKNNVIRNCRIGIRPTTTGTCDKLDIIGNTFVLPSGDAQNHIDSNQTGTVSNVTIRDNVFHNGAKALSISSTGTWTGLTYANNDHRGVTDAWSFGSSIVLTKVNIRGNTGLRYATTDATNNAKLAVPVPELQGYQFRLRSTGISDDSTVRGDYLNQGYAYRATAGTATIVNTATVLNETDAGLDSAPSISSNAIQHRFTGKAATNMGWVLDIDIASTN